MHGMYLLEHHREAARFKAFHQDLGVGMRVGWQPNHDVLGLRLHQVNLTRNVIDDDPYCLDALLIYQN